MTGRQEAWNQVDSLLPVVGELQMGVRDLEVARGTSHESVDQKALILAEESFEVLKMLRARSGAATDFYWNRGGLGGELLDVLFVSSAIANRLDISLRDEVRAIAQRKDSDLKDLSTNPGSAALHAGLAVADRVLCVIRSCSQLPSSSDSIGGDDFVQAREKAAVSLARLTLAVLILSAVEGIDLAHLTGRTLAYDQLRLWTHGDDDV